MKDVVTARKGYQPRVFGMEVVVRGQWIDTGMTRRSHVIVTCTDCPWAGR
jgi:hypothetical protein